MIDFHKAHVLVVGDIMLDRYWDGSTSRISPEAPVPVVHVQNCYDKAGGAGNVALNIATLGGHASVLAITGQDEAAQTLEHVLTTGKVKTHFVQSQSTPTIHKLRLLSQHQQLIRADFEERFPKESIEQIHADFGARLEHVTAVIISDYGKGTLSNIPQLIAKAKAHNIPVLVDPKSTDFSHYHGATLITPNYKEFIAAAGPCANEAELIRKAQKLIQQHNLGGLLITRGADGMTLVQPDQDPVSIPTQAREVYDVTGAGDTVIATMATGLATGKDWVSTMHCANAAASVVVGKIGTATVTPQELHKALHKTSEIQTGIIAESALKAIIDAAKHQGDTIVMTNGCFDLLHPGHIDYLQAARKLGDRLIVAVNDDASVQRLKGKERPINTLQNRMHCLAALSCVDWVISFSEDTPERIITALTPAVLVKGADYQIDQIAGAKEVLANGGKVETITLTPECSTSSLIQKIKAL